MPANSTAKATFLLYSLAIAKIIVDIFSMILNLSYEKNACYNSVSFFIFEKLNLIQFYAAADN